MPGNKGVNPDFRATVRKKEFPADAGPLIVCPKCKKPLMNAIVERFKKRCPHCGRWIYMEKVVVP